jgi:hypothetical protein
VEAEGTPGGRAWGLPQTGRRPGSLSKLKSGVDIDCQTTCEQRMVARSPVSGWALETRIRVPLVQSPASRQLWDLSREGSTHAVHSSHRMRNASESLHLAR